MFLRLRRRLQSAIHAARIVESEGGPSEEGDIHLTKSDDMFRNSAIKIAAPLVWSLSVDAFVCRGYSRSRHSTLPLRDSKDRHHVVCGIDCVEVTMDIPTIGRVVVLEATAESQDLLVNLALEEAVDVAMETKLNSGDPYGTVLWPAAYAVAAKILEDSSYRSALPQQTVLELGAGTGLISLALSLAGAKQVIATDYEQITLQILEYAAINLNPHEKKLNDTNPITYQLLDMTDYNNPLPPADLVVAADIMYEPKTGRAMARRAVEALRRGARVIVGDSPGRPGRGAFLEELRNLGVSNAMFVDAVGYTCSSPRHELICGKDSQSISETPRELLVAVMELEPNVHLPMS